MRERSQAEWTSLARGELARVIYGLWRRQATGVLTLAPQQGRATVVVLRKGAMAVPLSDALGRQAALTLATLCSHHAARYHFDGGVQAHPPGGSNFQLGRWVRRHFESQVDRQRALAMTRELAGVRLQLRASMAPPDSLCDETDKRILLALAHPRRLEQVWSIARCPRFRLLAFVHFLQKLDAISLHGVAVRPARDDHDDIERAKRLLGVVATDDRSALKRAYRRRVRALHPDLRTKLGGKDRRLLEERLVDVNGAYRLLTTRA